VKLTTLRYFVKIAELENFHRASEQLCIAQPALTRQIMQLESELGVQLFERLPRGVRLTPAGQTFRDGAKRVLADVDQLVQNARGEGADPFGHLRVAFEDSVSQNPIIAKSLQIIRSESSRVEIKLIPLSERHQVEQLKNREIDIGFAYDSCGEFSRHAELDCFKLGEDDLVLAMPHDHRLAALPVIRTEDLRDEPFVMIAKDKAPKLGYNHLINKCEEAGLSPRIVQEVPSIDGLFNLVSVGVGLTLCARSVRRMPPENVILRRVKGLDVRFNFTLMWRRHSQSAASRRFVEIAKSMGGGCMAPDIAQIPRHSMGRVYL